MSKSPFVLPWWAVVLLLAGFVGLVLATRAFAFPSLHRDMDAASYWLAGRTAFVDEASPYGLEVARTARERWIPESKLVPPFLYTPVALLAFGGLQLLALSQATSLIVVLNVLATVATLAFLAFTLGLGHSRRAAWTFALYSLLFAPFYESIGYGQVNLPLLLLLCVGWHAHRSGRASTSGGVAVALAVFLKLHYGLLLLPLLLRKRWRLLGVFAACLVLGGVVSAALFPFQAWGEWLEHVVRTSSVTQVPEGLSIASPTNLSVPAATARYLLPNRFFSHLPVPTWVATLVPTVLCGAIVAWTAWVLWRSSLGPSTSESRDAEIALILAATFEVSPISWGHHLVFLLPAVFLLGRHVVLSPRDALPRRVFLAAVFIFLALNPIVFGPLGVTFMRGIATLRSAAALCVWGVMSVWLLRLSKEPHADAGASRVDAEPASLSLSPGPGQSPAHPGERHAPVCVR